jgi:16S rRNA (cytidine1402-2'-O)-methyltransferase
MTKAHEEFLRGRLSDIRRRLSERKAVKGECTLLVAGAADASQPADAELAAAVKEAFAQGMGVSEAAKTVAARFGVTRGRVYPMALDIRKGSGDS